MTLLELLAGARRSAEYRRAKHNARADRDLLATLVRMRVGQGMSQADLATAAGISQQAISRFERTDGDPKLSTIRQYADAVGALVCHTVDADRGQLEHGGALRAMSFTTVAPVVHGFVTKSSTYAAPSSRTRFALSA